MWGPLHLYISSHRPEPVTKSATYGLEQAEMAPGMDTGGACSEMALLQPLAFLPPTAHRVGKVVDRGLR